MRKILGLLIVFLMHGLLSLAQTGEIKGRILDDKGAPVPFATVTIVGTNRAVTADADGQFTIKAAETARLSISATGFQTQTIAGSAAQSIALVKAESEMTEVLVTALGIRRQAKELGYSATRISNALLTQGKAVNVQQGLTGKISGVNITTVNSGVFEEARINLRGVRSLTGNNQPLLIVDNIPTPLTFLSTLNPTDIQEITVLKGASASALYGPDGVNGVILVTTRRAASGKPFVNIGYTAQLARVSYMPDLQKSFGGGTSEDALGRPLYDPIENQQFGPEFNGEMVPLGPVLEDGSQQMVRYSANDDRKKFWNQNGLTTQTDVSFGGEGFYISFQDANIKGLMPKDKNRRSSIRLNAEKSYGKFRASANLSYIQSSYNVVDNGAYARRFPDSYNGSVYFTVLNTPAHVPLLSYKDAATNKFAEYSNYYNEYFVNPYWVIDNHRNKGRTDNLLGSIEANYDFSKLVNLTYRLGTSFGFVSDRNEMAAFTTSDFAQSNRGPQFDPQPSAVGGTQNFNSRVTHELFFNGSKELGDFKASYILGGRYRENVSRNMGVFGVNLQVPDLYNVSVRTGEPIVNELNFKTRLISLFGQLSLNYKGWANVEFAFANDWDSRLDVDKNPYFYPTVNASVILTDALPGLKSNTLSYAKIRGAVSRSANVNLGPYQLQPVFNTTNGFPYGNLGGFSADGNLTNPFIEPEFVNSVEFGTELSFMRNRINIDATYFYQRNTDQILSIQQSDATGFGTYTTNAASFNNQGIELDLNLTPLVKVGNGRINFAINATYNDNKIIELYEGINELSIGGTANFTQRSASSPDVSNFAIVGQPAFVFKMTDYVRNSEGKVVVDRVTGFPSLSPELVTKGRTLPLWILGFNPSFAWKGLNVGMTWDYRGGHYAYHGFGNDMDFTGISARSTAFGRERFVFPNSVYDDGTGKYVDNKNVQVQNGSREFFALGTTNTSVGTNYFTSAAFWKLRELAISYNLPLPFIGEDKIIKRVVVSAVGRNLLVILPKSNQWTDPEFNYTSSGNTFGINNVFSTPPARFFGGSVVLTF